MAESQFHEIELFGNTVEYEVRHSDDATEPRIDVDIHGVTVVVPDSEEIQPSELLRDNAAWVMEKQRTYDSYREDIPDRSFEAGESFPYLGEERELIIESATSHAVTDDVIRLRKSAVEQSSIKQTLKNLYRKKAREYLVEQADYYSEQMGVEYKQIEIRNQRTKWGSCSTTGTLGLNWRLMMAPPKVVDYIVVHELAHLRESNHNESFWSLVAEYDPEYESHAEWLAENSTRLIFSKEDL
ncbi:M48 family metallopeptidase [Natronoarchaeum sp. GCM10025703]|uniref:M48 family metallopeptidase n=1 Tax=unclassified Natronoarchaeum TaxID=2620183 RepID=UPI003617D919